LSFWGVFVHVASETSFRRNDVFGQLVSLVSVVEGVAVVFFVQEVVDTVEDHAVSAASDWSIASRTIASEAG
jgi:hypothetical protein